MQYVKQLNVESSSRRSRLSVRIPVFILIFSIVVALSASIIQLFIEYKKEETDITSRIKDLELSNADTLAVSIWKLDEEQIYTQLNNMLQIPDLKYMEIQSADLGEIIVGKKPETRFVGQTVPLIYSSSNELIQVGTLLVIASLDGVNKKIHDRALLILSTEIIKTFLVSIFILLLIYYLVTRHLTRMSSYVRELNIANLDEQLILSGHSKNNKSNELDDLVTAINSMLLDLRKTHYELKMSYYTLEQKVEERTRELQLAKEEAEKSSQAKSEFLSTINHELRTPLTSILGGLGLVTKGAMGEIPEKMVSPLTIAYNNSQRLLLLVNDILDIAKVEAGHLSLNCESVNLKSFLEKSISQNEAYAVSFNVELSLISCPENLTMIADEHRLLQVMSNLISNAIKFTNKGDIIEIRAEQDNRYIKISVCDHGPGIPENLREKIFEKFTQADSSDTRVTGGTGLGLAISRSIAELHGGSINFNSTLGQGTIFYVCIPVNKTDEISSID